MNNPISKPILDQSIAPIATQIFLLRFRIPTIPVPIPYRKQKRHRYRSPLALPTAAVNAALMNSISEFAIPESYRELISTRTGESFSYTHLLSEAWGLKKLSVHHEMIPPGRRSSGHHAHSELEEIFILLSGSATLYTAQEKAPRILNVGEFQAFAPGEFHSLWNHTSEVATVLVVKSNTPTDRVTYDTGPLTP